MANKFILITGASSGIGKATALHLAHSGYTVFAGVRTQKSMDELLDLGIANLQPIQLDVTQKEDIDQAFEWIKSWVGTTGLTAVINNAGNGYSAPTEHFDEEKARSLMETHFWGTAMVTRSFLPLLRIYAKNNWNKARIINVSSVSGISAFPFIQFYIAAKFAMVGFTESLRLELEPLGIKAISILPGAVKTEIWRKTDAAMEDALAGLNMEALASYQENITLGRRLAASLEKSGVSVEKAARLFKLALEQDRPKLKYFIGSDAKMVNFLVKYLPDGFRMGLIKIQLRFKKMR